MLQCQGQMSGLFLLNEQITGITNVKQINKQTKEKREHEPQ